MTMAVMSMAALVQAYLDHLTVERGVSAHTSGAYRRDLGRYVDFLARNGVTQPEAVTTGLVQAYVVELRTGRPTADGSAVAPLAASSTARAVVAVRSLHRFALAEGIAADDPAHSVAPPKPARRLPKALSIDQVQRMLDGPGTDTPVGLRDGALLELLYGTGARISEVVTLDVDDVTRVLDVAAGSAEDLAPGLRVLGKGGRERIVPVGSYARAALDAYLVRGRPSLAARAAGTPALFLNTRGGRLSRQSAWGILRDVAARVGIAADVSPHTLRHSFATHLLDGGADVRVVQELLGHASVTTTQIYTLVTVDHLREVYLTAHPRA